MEKDSSISKQSNCQHQFTQEHILGTGTGDYKCIKCGYVTSDKNK